MAESLCFLDGGYSADLRCLTGEGLYERGGRLTLQGNVGLFKIDRLFPDYVTQQSAGKDKDTVHFALTQKGHSLVERALKAGR